MSSSLPSGPKETEATSLENTSRSDGKVTWTASGGEVNAEYITIGCHRYRKDGEQWVNVGTGERVEVVKAGDTFTVVDGPNTFTLS